MEDDLDDKFDKYGFFIINYHTSRENVKMSLNITYYKNNYGEPGKKVRSRHGAKDSKKHHSTKQRLYYRKTKQIIHNIESKF